MDYLVTEEQDRILQFAEYDALRQALKEIKEQGKVYTAGESD